MKRTWSQAEEYGELGIIESVSLRNFMCHDNLSFEFDPHMNFIVGRNGSGKSAVLTGIILALGGKSGVTGRYSNIKGFVKTGKNSATVSVTLKNCGPEAYKPDEFGSRIIVDRQISVEGNSVYKLKSEAGRIVSQSKEELTNILNIMDIQIDNPISVLTQETSRNFLTSKNAKGEKLFQLFYKGTGLAKVHEDYNRAVQQKTEARMELQKKKSVLPDMKKDIKKLKSLLDKSSEKMELKKELLWAVVIEFEKKRNRAQEALDKVMKDFSDHKEKLKKCENEVAIVSQNVTTALADKQSTSTEMDTIRRALTDLHPQRIAIASDIRELQGTYSSHKREVQKFSSEITTLENIITEIRTKKQNDLNVVKSRHEQIVDNLKSQMASIKAQINKLEEEKNSLRESWASANKKLEVCNAEIQEKFYEKDKLTKEKQQLVDGMTNRINVFGPEMRHVLREIESATAAGRFKVKPKGPIGMYINVKHPDWVFAVQECLKTRFLKTFLCDNYSDADQLSQILAKYYQRNRPSIITSKFVSEVYDVSPHKTVCEHPTVLDMINVDDPVITNCLIDHSQIENILLIADPGQALNLMLYKPPNKCRFAYTPNGDLYCHTPFRNFSCRNMNQICMLKTVNKDDIRKKDEELKVLDEATADKKRDKGSLVQQIRLKEQLITAKDNEITQLKISHKQLHIKLIDEENNYEEPKDIDCLHSDLVQAQNEKKLHEERFVACEEAMNSKKDEVDDLDKKIEELRRNLQVQSRNYHALSEKVDDCQSKKEKLDSTIKKIKGVLKEIEPVLEEHKKELSDSEATVKVATKHALDASPRIDTKRSSDTIRQTLKEIEKYIQKQKNCDRQALLKEYEEKIQSLNKASSELERQEKINSRLDIMMAQRFQQFQKICKNTSVSLTCCFSTLLKENNFQGYPDVNFDQRSLEIVAKPLKIRSKHTSKHNLAQLSGGERSYVTIAFLLSLWDRIHMPFRILDEYDVFMDANNRHLSIHLLINTAKGNKKIQYIFLSPLELPQIEDSDHVKIHKMPAPRK